MFDHFNNPKKILSRTHWNGQKSHINHLKLKKPLIPSFGDGSDEIILGTSYSSFITSLIIDMFLVIYGLEIVYFRLPFL